MPRIPGTVGASVKSRMLPLVLAVLWTVAGCGSSVTTPGERGVSPKRSPSDDGPEALRERPPERPAPRRLGRMWNTYYVISHEDDFRGARNTPLYDTDCEPIARVRRRFYDDLCTQGSGVLSTGQVVNFGRRCTRACPRAPRCGSAAVRVCYMALPPQKFPFGMGAGVPLVPGRSIAVDPELIPLESWVYMPELEGVTPPGFDEPHDGCVRAEDTGGGIRNRHFDLFAGTREQWHRWERILPTRSKFTAWLHHPRCAGRGGYRVQMPPFSEVPELRKQTTRAD